MACILIVILSQQTILFSETFWVLSQSLLAKDEQVNDAVAKSTKKKKKLDILDSSKTIQLKLT
jgi:ATP/ADP translocase